MDEPPEPDPQAKKPPSRLTAWLILGGITVAAVVMFVLLIGQRSPAKGDELGGVELTISSKQPGVPFTVDGAKAGRTPQALKIKGSRTKPLVIKGNGVVKTVTPDHDQVVTLDP